MNPNDPITNPVPDTSVQATVDPPLPPAEPGIVPPVATPIAPESASNTPRTSGPLWGCVLPSTILLSVFGLALMAMPYLLAHWRIISAKADAEAAAILRRAELKAEAEHADERLQVMDKRVHLVSLGFREVARKVLPNVVNIINFREPSQGDLEAALDEKVRLVYDPDNGRKYVQQGVGSGVIYQPGVILTNHHVIWDAKGERTTKRLRITFTSGRWVNIDVDRVVSDNRADLAVIRLPGDLPTALKEDAENAALFADSDKDVFVGDWTLAMGSPLDLRQSVTQGIVSSKGRLLSLQKYHRMVDLIQTTAAIHPGNSGGPLFDQLGRVIGINVAVAFSPEGGQGIGFAIPSNTAKRVADSLLANGEVARGFLGIAMSELPGPELKSLKVEGGAMVVKRVEPGLAADMAGLKTGDIILRVNGEPLERWNTERQFRQLILDIEPGAKTQLDIVRDGRRQTITVIMGKRPKDLP